MPMETSSTKRKSCVPQTSPPLGMIELVIEGTPAGVKLATGPIYTPGYMNQAPAAAIGDQTAFRGPSTGHHGGHG